MLTINPEKLRQALHIMNAGLEIGKQEHNNNFELINTAFTETPEPKWKPKQEEKYYYLKPYGKVENTNWYNTEFDNDVWSFGNCFKTPNEAEAARDKIIEILK